jgi:protein-L-isoaspartate(D-aspartate) O-methyltransferase
MTMNFERARFNMVEQQVRPWEVLDARVLALMESIQREDFVPVRYRKLAFADLNIPLDHGQVMMKPIVEGRMLQALQLRADETVLEIGTGSGFVTACLAGLAAEVVSVDIFPEFTEQAGRRLQEKEIHHVELHSGDVMSGWQPDHAHDVVAVTASMPMMPEQFKGWVNPGGRLFVICGAAPAMEACLFTRLNASDWRRESLFETDLPALVNAAQAPSFEF